MHIYLIRHTTPDVVKGTCYGQLDLNVVDTFFEEAAAIKEVIPSNIMEVHSSPLRRCYLLANQLFAPNKIAVHDHLKEINCGDWEGKMWDELPPEVVNPWMDNFVKEPMPNGENYLQLFERTTQFFEERVGSWEKDPRSMALVTHGGVIRSILSHLTGTPLIDSFKTFSLQYGCVVEIEVSSRKFQVLHNPPSVAEQHKPSKRTTS